MRTDDTTSALTSEAQFAHSDPEGFAARLAEHLASHDGTVTRVGETYRIRFHYGGATIAVEPQALVFRARAASRADLNGVKHMLTALAEFFSPHDPLRIDWAGDRADGTLPPNFRELTVVSARQMTPRMKRVTLRGHDLASFASIRNIHARLLFPPPGVELPEWPRLSHDGHILWPGGDAKLSSRIYTIRRADADRGLLDIDFAIHEAGGPGLRWALEAGPGERVGLLGPGGHGLRDADRYLFVGDETGLPAIARMLEALPASASGQAIVEIADTDETQLLPSHPGFEVIWLPRAVHGGGQLPQTVETILPKLCGERTFAWIGCEFSDFRSLRTLLRNRGFAKRDIVAFSHWRRGLSDEQALEQAAKEPGE